MYKSRLRSVTYVIIIFLSSLLQAQWSDPTRLTAGNLDGNPSMCQYSWVYNTYFVFERAGSSVWYKDLSSMDTGLEYQLYPRFQNDNKMGVNPHIIDNIAVWEAIQPDSSRLIISTNLSNWDSLVILDTIPKTGNIMPYSLTTFSIYYGDYRSFGVVWVEEDSIKWSNYVGFLGNIWWDPQIIAIGNSPTNPRVGSTWLSPQNVYVFILWEEVDSVGSILCQPYYENTTFIISQGLDAHNPYIHGYYNIESMGITFEVRDSSGTSIYEIPIDDWGEIHWDSVRVLIDDEGSQHDFISSDYGVPAERLDAWITAYIQDNGNTSFVMGNYDNYYQIISDSQSININPTIGTVEHGHVIRTWIIWEKQTVISNEIWGCYYDHYVGIKAEENSIPNNYRLHQNHPNPFNPLTTIRYDLPEQARVTLVIYDLLGREVRTLVSGTQEPGFKLIIWDGKDEYGQAVSTGVYLYRITTKDFVRTRKMVLLQ